MKKIEVFSSRCFIDIDKEVNEFLVETNVKFIDIKYNSTIAIDSYNKVVEQYSALLVYEEVEND
ncbi:TPA: sporulation protein Cse60 [Streptococcus suis]